ncbi:MAG: Gfo/Idh/MocA family oxidoreductase [Anaerolineae bacterium]|jgi:predicted dehydrogenase|nr:Gfo/Idh/MocA family oxidoreductase [Anaerolineae bacterium]
MDTIRWGIVGTGKIARQFAKGLEFVEDARLVAVGSRQAETAAAFGELFRVPQQFASYEELVACADVDVVYIATPHTLHYELMRLCLEAGKHVLCEKPFTLNAPQAREVVALARRRRLFLMEAMWMRFIPAVIQARRWITTGAIGNIRLIQASLCFRAPFDQDHRLFNPHLGGGALLDAGIYPLSLTTMLMGAMPDSMMSRASLGTTGVDEHNVLVPSYKSGAIGLLTSAIRTYQPMTALIAGETGTITLHEPFYKAERVTLTRPGHSEETRFFPHKGNGYEYEIMEVHACLRAEKTESAIMPLDESVSLMNVMDGLRATWGLRYPGE